MAAQVLTPLQSLETSLNTLITSLTTSNTFSAAPNAAQALIAADTDLTSRLSTLRIHQQNHARILSLRAEAARLEDNLKSIIRTCVDLKAEIGSIHPDILATDDREEEQINPSTPQDVDYKTLLTFAARIGKHNSLAALEAERDSTRRKVESSQQRRLNQNKDPGTAAAAIANGPTSPTGQENTTATAESAQELQLLETNAAARRAQLGMAFPDGELLRLGALGRLQIFRERENEDAVEREVERLVRETETVAPKQQEATKMEIDMPAEMEDHDPEPESQPKPPLTRPRRKSSGVQGQSQASRPQIKKKLDLDFPGSDDDDDD